MGLFDERLRPLLLEADNFTPRARTPWGGERILRRYKADVALHPDRAAQGVVGESWEISVEPDFPSLVDGGRRTLREVIARHPERYLGRGAPLGGSALLVKLLDAADDLSVQIHPADDHPGLAADESGKPESWYVLDADPGAGLYLGLREGVTRAELAETLAAEGDVSALLAFVPAAPGDFFVIDAGTAHAIGRGLTLVEPQRVLPGKRGVTYRYWDWNRRYAPDGTPSPDGAPRALHVEQALAVTAWEAPREEALLARARYRAGRPDLQGPPRVTWLGTPAGPARSAQLAVARLSGTGGLELGPMDALTGLTVLEGVVILRGRGFEVSVGRGRSAVVPAGLGAVDTLVAGAHAIVSVVVPPA